MIQLHRLRAALRSRVKVSQCVQPVQPISLVSSSTFWLEVGETQVCIWIEYLLPVELFLPNVWRCTIYLHNFLINNYDDLPTWVIESPGLLSYSLPYPALTALSYPTLATLPYSPIPSFATLGHVFTLPWPICYPTCLPSSTTPYAVLLYLFSNLTNVSAQSLACKDKI